MFLKLFLIKINFLKILFAFFSKLLNKITFFFFDFFFSSFFFFNFSDFFFLATFSVFDFDLDRDRFFFAFGDFDRDFDLFFLDFDLDLDRFFDFDRERLKITFWPKIFDTKENFYFNFDLSIFFSIFDKIPIFFTKNYIFGQKKT